MSISPITPLKVLTIQCIRHDGTDILKSGEEWQQHLETIGPWETKSVVDFNRWKGIKAGKKCTILKRLFLIRMVKLY